MSRYETVCDICGKEHQISTNISEYFCDHAFSPRKQTPPRFALFSEKNKVLLNYEKLPRNIREFVIAKTLGAYSVVSGDMKFWEFLEKYTNESLSLQPQLFQEPTGNKIDSFIDQTHEKLDKR
jgi:hypothetical protein